MNNKNCKNNMKEKNINKNLEFSVDKQIKDNNLQNIKINDSEREDIKIKNNEKEGIENVKSENSEIDNKIMETDKDDDEDADYNDDNEDDEDDDEEYDEEYNEEYDEEQFKHNARLLALKLKPDELQIIDESSKIPDFLLAKAQQIINPDEYVDKYCTDNKLSNKKRKKLKKLTTKYLDLNDKDKEEKTELDYFLNSDDNSRRNIVKSLELLNTMQIDDIPYKFKILSSKMDLHSKNIAIYKAKQLSNTEPGTGEYYKLKNWMDTLLNIPWSEYRYINIHSSMISSYLSNARYTMDNVIYGQNETKDVIIQIISKMISNPNRCGNVFAVHGPPGVGKTTIIKEGMSKALNLPFAFISLGGATDSSYLDGHGYTYEGSIPGKIVDVITKVKCMNPIFILMS